MEESILDKDAIKLTCSIHPKYKIKYIYIKALTEKEEELVIADTTKFLQ